MVPRGDVAHFAPAGYSVMLGLWDEPEKTTACSMPRLWGVFGCTTSYPIIDFRGFIATSSVRIRTFDPAVRTSPRGDLRSFCFRHPISWMFRSSASPTDRYGEELCAWISASPGDSDRRRVRTLFMPVGTQDPALRRVRREFPMTVTGKIQNFMMPMRRSKLGLKGCEVRREEIADPRTHCELSAAIARATQGRMV